MAKTLSEKHPMYTEMTLDWELMRDAYKGERRVKDKGTIYLPHTIGHIMDGAQTNPESTGAQAYQAYKKRARFSNFVREAVQTAIGMMHSQPPKIELPKAMEKIRSSKGESLPDFLRRINVEQLITGRLGIMADIAIDPAPGEDIPYLALYTAERILNWDDGKVEETVPQALNVVVLNESEFERAMGLSWTKEEKYRVLSLGDFAANEQRGKYQAGVFKAEDYLAEQMTTPSFRGRDLNKIPFVLINSSDLTSEVDEPPLLDLANLCMSIYRMDADYRQNLFMQGQDTFVTIGGIFAEDEAVRTGAGARIDLPLGGDAKYVGVQSTGIQEQREALERMEARAGSMGAQTLDTVSRERESGASLTTRIAARTADMNQIVEVGAAALEHLLKTVAEWMGENPDEVSVTPNKDFGELPLTGQTMVEMATARTLGFPLSARSMHNLALRRRMTQLTFEEEMAAQKEEDEDDHPFAKPETADRAGADQNSEGDNTSDDLSARNEAQRMENDNE